MPPKPRRIILDLFGEYLRFVGAEVRLGQLTTLLGAFDVAPATVRVTMSRLRRDGWFTSRRDGRETVYRLTSMMLGVLDEGRERIFTEPVGAWDGVWTMVLYQLSEDERQERQQLRKDLVHHGFGFLGTSTWLAPGDRRDEAHRLGEELAPGQVEVLRCLSEGPEHDVALAARCWDLPGLAADYDTFLTEYARYADDPARLTGADALRTRTLLISAYRHFPYRDPRLPAELTPPAWPGPAAYRLFAHLHDALGPAARAYVSEVVGRSVEEPAARA